MNLNNKKTISYTYNVDVLRLSVVISKVVDKEVTDNFIFDCDDNNYRFKHPTDIYEFAENKVKELEALDNVTGKKVTLSKFQFLSMFTNEELALLYETAKNNTTIQVIMALFEAADEIDMQNERTVQAFDQFINLGLLTRERYDEIIAAL